MPKLRHIVEIQNPKTKVKNNDYIYPYYDSNGIKGFVKESLFTGEHIVTARKLSIGSVHYVNGPYSPSDNTINITCSECITHCEIFKCYICRI